MALFFLLGEILNSACLDLPDLAIRYVQWGCRLEAGRGRRYLGRTGSHPGSDQSWTSVTTRSKSHLFCGRRSKDFLLINLFFISLDSASKGRLVMRLWSGHSGQTCECSFVSRYRSSLGWCISCFYTKCVVKLAARHPGGFLAVAMDATLNIPMLCAQNEEKLTFWLPIQEWDTWFTVLLPH